MSYNGYKKYVDIMPGEKLSSIYLANMELIYWSVCSFSRRGWDGVKGVGVVIVARCKFHYIREHEINGVRSKT